VLDSVDFDHIQKHNLQTKELDIAIKAQTRNVGQCSTWWPPCQI